MPEYLAPGVFVEEVSYRAKSIEGVSTTTTGFIGPTRDGPIDDEPDVLTSLVEYERAFGDRQQLVFAGAEDAPVDNYMWHAVRAFFENGGKRLYVKRVFAARPPAGGGEGDWRAACARASLGGITIRSRYPGRAGARRVRLELRVGPNLLAVEGSGEDQRTVVRGALHEHDVVLVGDVAWSPPGSPPDSPPGTHVGSPPAAVPGTPRIAHAATDAQGGATWRFERPGGDVVHLHELRADRDPDWSDTVRVVTLALTVEPSGPDDVPVVWDGLPLDPRHTRAGARDSVFARFAERLDSRSAERGLPVVVDAGGIGSGLGVLDALAAADNAQRGAPAAAAASSALHQALVAPGGTATAPSIEVMLRDGDDGVRPGVAAYEGDASDTDDRTGLKAFEEIEDISIVAAPGSTFGYQTDTAWRPVAATIAQLLIGHAERMRYRIAVLDSGDVQTVADVRQMRATIDSKHAAFYYPWVRVLDPVTQREIHLPPSGFVAGIYARNDVNRAVYKAPANEVVTLAIGFERMLTTGQQEVLNPEGVNCFRFFEGRGMRLWGARTTSSDPEWKYVNLRRYFAYLERSIDRGTQWAVFEPNGEALWANVRRTISDFLFNEFVNGALLGERPESAYFVKCDRSTMTQNDLDNGRLVCLIGVAALRPAEFVIFRIGQWTADARR